MGLNPNVVVKKFFVISTHVKPESGGSSMLTEDEINHLEDVYNDAISQYPDFEDAIIAGDMNADCTYDHIVLRGPNMASAFHSAQVFDYQTFYDTDNIFYNGDPITDLISDHFPVEVSFN